MPENLSSQTQQINFLDPKVNTTKVFSTVGIILTASILIIGGLWIYLGLNKSVPMDDSSSTTKIATSSSKSTETPVTKDETADWEKYSTIDGGFSLKHPADLKKTSESDLKTNPSSGKFEVYFSEKDFTIIVDKWLGAQEKTDVNSTYTQISESKVGLTSSKDIDGRTHTRQADVTVGGGVGVSELVDTGIVGTRDAEPSRYLIKTYVKRSTDVYSIFLYANGDNELKVGRETLDKVISTFKFL